MINKRFLSNYYQVYCRKKNCDSLISNAGKLKEFKKIKNPFGYWIADPFVIKMDGKNYVFAERFGLFSGRGSIVYTCIDERRNKWRLAIKEKYHMSFPNIFINANDVFLVPETAKDNNSVSIYKASRFPFSWKKEKVIFQKEGYHPVDSISLDPQPFSKTMLTYIEKDNKKELLLLSKDNDWFVEKKSFIDTNLNLRPAGSPFLFNGSLVIPFQDCFRTYGGGMLFRKASFNKDELVLEDVLFEINPKNITECLATKKIVVGTHTYNQNDDFEVIDIKTLKFSILGFLDKIFKKVFEK